MLIMIAATFVLACLCAFAAVLRMLRSFFFLVTTTVGIKEPNTGVRGV
jgi:hypothetical protein